MFFFFFFNWVLLVLTGFLLFDIESKLPWSFSARGKNNLTRSIRGFEISANAIDAAKTIQNLKSKFDN